MLMVYFRKKNLADIFINYLPIYSYINIGIFHWGGKENFTKYGMVVAMSEVFGLNMDHIIADPNPVPGAPRPHNAQLSNIELEKLNIGHHTPFRIGIDSALRSWVQRLQTK
jgi:hypothetical protein